MIDVVVGLPPLARGRLQWRARTGPKDRITPACAGTTPEGRLPVPLRPDYPRLRGDDWVCGSGGWVDAGLPPPARGRRIIPAGRRHRTRITPACAGTTNLDFSWVAAGWGFGGCVVELSIDSGRRVRRFAACRCGGRAVRAVGFFQMVGGQGAYRGLSRGGGQAPRSRLLWWCQICGDRWGARPAGLRR